RGSDGITALWARRHAPRSRNLALMAPKSRGIMCSKIRERWRCQSLPAASLRGRKILPAGVTDRSIYVFDGVIFYGEIVSKIDIFPVLRELQKAVGVDVDLDAGGAGGADAGEPIAQYCLEPHFAHGLDEKPLAVAAAQYGERRGCGAEHRDPG